MLIVFKNFLIKWRLYNLFRYSWLAGIFYRIFRPGKRKELIREIHFYHSFLPPCQLIFDIGANDGHKTLAFAALSEKVIACEPDPHCLEILNIRFRNKKKVLIEPLALTNFKGTANFYVHRPGSALNTINPGFKTILETDEKKRWKEPVQYSGSMIQVNTTTLNDLISKHGIPQFIKIDVEGNELKVLKGLSHSIPYISFELLLPEFLNQALEAMQLLLALDERTRFNYSVDEKLVLKDFIPYDKCKEILHGLSIYHLEIIAATVPLANRVMIG